MDLVNYFCNHLGDSLLMFSAPGVASVLTFQKCCHFQLSATNDLDKSNISVIPAQVKEKAVKNCEDGETICKMYFGSG